MDIVPGEPLKTSDQNKKKQINSLIDYVVFVLMKEDGKKFDSANNTTIK